MPNNPGFNVDVDRTLAQYVGLTQRDVTNSMVVNLAAPRSGADLLSQPRQRRVLFGGDADAAVPLDSLSKLEALPISAAGVRDAAAARRPRQHQAHASNAVVSQYDIQTMVQIYATAQAATRAVATDIRKAIADPPGRAARQPRRAARPGRDHGQRLRGLLFGLSAPSC